MVDTTYYAGPESDTKTAASKIFQLLQRQQNKLYGASGISKIWDRNLEIYYKNALCDVLEFAGNQGELVSMSVPQARSLTRQTVAIVCKQKLNFKALERSSDYTAMACGKISEAIANQVKRTQKLDEKKDLIAEKAYVYGQAFWHVEWDSEAGYDVPSSVPSLQPQKSGDVKISVLDAKAVYYDINASSWDDLNCVTIEEKANRYDLVALHPELEKEILQLPKYDSRKFNQSNIKRFSDQATDENDLVAVYKYYHKISPACPFGRLVILASESCVFYDGPNPYECLPVIPLMPEKMDGVLLGYPQFSNLAPAQEMLDHNFSVIASNQSAFGVQTVLNPRGSNIDVKQIDGMQWVDYTPQSIDGGGKPEPLQLTRTAPELLEMLPVYKTEMAEIANISGALRGTPPAGITAGNALATLTANSIEFMSAFSMSLYQSIEEVMTLCVHMYKMLGAENQMVMLADGKTSYAQEFKNSDLAAFERITLDITNPTMATYGGRQNDAEQLLAAGLIQDIGTYYRVKDGAPVNTIYNTAVDESNLIQKENDDLSQGIPCPVLFTDSHDMHILQHKSLLSDPERRRNGQLVQAVLDHISQHEQLKMAQMQPMMPPQGVPGAAPQSTQGPAPGQEPSGAAPAQPAQPAASF